MQTRLVAAAGLFAALPGLVLFLFAASSILQLIGISIMGLGGIIFLLAIFSKRGTALAWLALILSLFTLVLGNGYIPAVANFGLGFDPALVELFALSIVFIELSIATSSIFGTHARYSVELEKAGYDKAEFQSELGAFSNFMFLAVLAVGALACGVFAAFEFVPQIPIDSITGLIAGMIVYFVVAVYLMRKPPEEKKAFT